jgi:hypothetical protein
VHFLGTEKDGKSSERRDTDAQRKDLRKIGEEKPSEINNPGPPEGDLPTKNVGAQSARLQNRFAAKPFICITINHRSL